MKILINRSLQHQKAPFENGLKTSAECKEIVNIGAEVGGDRGNQQCLPALVDDLLKYCRYIPLFTAVMISFFPRAPVIGSSSTVESNFNNIKHRVFGNVALPIRVDDFLTSYITSTDGAVKLVQSAIDANLEKVTINL